MEALSFYRGDKIMQLLFIQERREWSPKPRKRIWKRKLLGYKWPCPVCHKTMSSYYTFLTEIIVGEKQETISHVCCYDCGRYRGYTQEELIQKIRENGWTVTIRRGRIIRPHSYLLL